MNKEEYISKCGNYKLEIIQDYDAESPNFWGNDDVFLVYDHRQFTVKRDRFDPNDIYDYITKKGEFEDFVKNKNIKNLSEEDQDVYDEFKVTIDDFSYLNDFYIFPVAAYIHSGISLSLTNSFERQGWDTSVSGFILVNKSELGSQDWKDKYHSGKTDEQIAEVMAKGLLETWNQYLIGDVYGYKLYEIDKRYSIPVKTWNALAEKGTMDTVSYFTEETEWEEIDSCWGFYGSDLKENGILEHIGQNIEFDI